MEILEFSSARYEFAAESDVCYLIHEVATLSQIEKQTKKCI